MAALASGALWQLVHRPLLHRLTAFGLLKHAAGTVAERMAAIELLVAHKDSPCVLQVWVRSHIEKTVGQLTGNAAINALLSADARKILDSICALYELDNVSTEALNASIRRNICQNLQQRLLHLRDCSALWTIRQDKNDSTSQWGVSVEDLLGPDSEQPEAAGKPGPQTGKVKLRRILKKPAVADGPRRRASSALAAPRPPPPQRPGGGVTARAFFSRHGREPEFKLPGSRRPDFEKLWAAYRRQAQSPDGFAAADYVDRGVAATVAHRVRTSGASQTDGPSRAMFSNFGFIRQRDVTRRTNALTIDSAARDLALACEAEGLPTGDVLALAARTPSFSRGLLVSLASGGSDESHDDVQNTMSSLRTICRRLSSNKKPQTV